MIGGAQIYAEALPLADELLLTEIDLEVEGDAFFPDWNRAAFEEVRANRTSPKTAPVRVRHVPQPLDVTPARRARPVDALLERAGIAYWLFGGWAVDFYAGSITRPHFDVDIAVWLDDLPRIAALLEADGWRMRPNRTRTAARATSATASSSSSPFSCAATTARRHAAARIRGRVARRRIRRGGA